MSTHFPPQYLLSCPNSLLLLVPSFKNSHSAGLNKMTRRFDFILLDVRHSDFQRIFMLSTTLDLERYQTFRRNLICNGSLVN